jgi:hypothetical protein
MNKSIEERLENIDRELRKLREELKESLDLYSNKRTKILGWEVTLSDPEGYADIIFELDVGFEDKTLDEAIAHVKSVCDYDEPVIISCVRKEYENI